MAYRTPNRLEEGLRNSIAAPFEPGHWYSVDGRQASREEIMMALANVENLLIRLQYIDQVQREVELLNIVMDSAAIRDQGLGSASLVEECRCPVGYSGLSCESCAHGKISHGSFILFFIHYLFTCSRLCTSTVRRMVRSLCTRKRTLPSGHLR